jgi:chromosome segregation ATPase
MSNESTLSFDRMRGMLMRAAEIRDSEQQQIFDSLDEIHARLAALDALGSMRKRLTELPDRTEVSVLAERLDETVAKLDAQDGVLASLLRAVESLPDKLAKPFAQLDGRLDGIGGRMEGISGRMDGLDDRLGGLHKRLDDLDNRLDRHEMRLDAMPSSVGTPIKERIDGVERQVREQLAAALRGFEETGEGLRNALGDMGVDVNKRLEELAGRPAVDPDDLTKRIEALVTRLDSVTARLDTLETGLGTRLDQSFAKIDAALVERPDTTAVGQLVARAHQESERRNAGQLDEAMATFAELILGRGAQVQAPPPPPRPTARRSRKVTVKSSNGASAADTVTDDPDD